MWPAPQQWGSMPDKLIRAFFGGLLLAAPITGLAARPAPAKIGVPAVQRPMVALPPLATIRIARTADGIAITPDAVWVAGMNPNVVRRIDPATNKTTAGFQLPGQPCAGIAVAFNSVWVPFCGKRSGIARIDPASGRTLAFHSSGPGPDGGIAASKESIWFTSGNGGTLVRLDPMTNQLRQTIRIAPGSHNPVASEDQVWVTSVERNVVTAIDAASGAVIATVKTGPRPRFLTIGAGSVWVLNQGDGSVTRIDAANRKVLATIQLGIAGPGGDITFGGSKVWAASRGIPLTEVDPASNLVTRQWVGPGGGSVRFSDGALWMTDRDAGTLSRFAPFTPPTSAAGLTGTWRLVSHVDKPEGRPAAYQFGKYPIGQFVFTADGHASIDIMRNPPDGPKRSAPNPDGCVPEWYCSYFGTYSLDAAQGSWILHVVGGNVPSLVGTEQRHSFRIEGRKLIISDTYQSDGRAVKVERVLERAD